MLSGVDTGYRLLLYLRAEETSLKDRTFSVSAIIVFESKHDQGVKQEQVDASVERDVRIRRGHRDELVV